MNNTPLLPSDRYIAELLGLSDEQYRFYIAEVRRRAAQGPQPSVTYEITTAAWATISVITSILSIGLTIVASFFKPRQNTSQAGRLVQNQIQGQVTTNIRRYTPRQGFDALQDVAGIGTPIPLIYTKRETIDGIVYGGLRVNIPLVWSQLQAADKGQILKALFVIGEGDNSITIDPATIGIGNNTLGAYLLGGTEHARFTVYFRPNGGRIATSHRVAGASNDPTVLPGTSDVFSVYDETGAPQPYFCHSRKPNTQTQFGVYSLIGNGLGFRVNPQLRPVYSAQVTVDVASGGDKKSGGGEAKGRIVCDADYVAMAQREKMKAKFSGRGGITGASGLELTYTLTNTSDALTVFQASADAQTWTGNKMLTVNPFLFSPNNQQVDSWLSFASVTSDGGNVTGVLVFDTAAAEQALTNTETGTYVMQWTCYYQSSGGQQLGFGHTVTVSITERTEEVCTPNPVFPSVIECSPVTVREFSFQNTNVSISQSFQSNQDYSEKCGDAASAIAGRQKSWDDALQVGELYKIGSALAVCTERSPDNEFFSSDADFPEGGGSGTSVTAKFKIVRTGSYLTVNQSDISRDAKSSPAFTTATNYSHILRVAIASITTLRECRIVELGIRSSLGIRINGLCNFRDSMTFAEMDGSACLYKQGQQIPPGGSIAVDIFNSGVLNSAEERYSFFRIRYKEAGVINSNFITLPQCFGIRGITQQNIHNTIRLVMPAQKRWEFQIEPLSGWEIRSGNATGDLELIDSNLTTVRTTTTVDGVTITFRGVVQGSSGPFMYSWQRASQGTAAFRLGSVERGSAPDIGIGYTDQNAFVDYWGKLAEAFVYEEVTSSASAGPEHEVVFINEILQNPVTPNYTNLALLGLTMRAGTEWQQFGQLSCYALSGLGNTHLFPDVLKDLMTNTRYGKGDQITLSLINEASFTAANTWCYQRRLFFDGAITGKTNLRQWAADVAASHLLTFGESDGQFYLQPAWPGTVSTPAAVTYKGIFTAGNIKEGSFSMEFFAPEDRKPIQVSVRYREERLSTNPGNLGLFSTEREILVREASPNGSDTDPTESIDLSDYCTSRNHAIDAAKFVIRMRRIPTHAIKFETTHEGILAAITPSDYIKVAMDITSYDTLNNGAVLEDGALVSAQPFSDGTYSVLMWDGKGSVQTPQTLTVTNGGKTASPTGIIFTVINSSTQVGTYQIERISPTSEGNYTIEAVHMPTSSSDIPLIALDFDSPSAWVIAE